MTDEVKVFYERFPYPNRLGTQNSCGYDYPEYLSEFENPDILEIGCGTDGSIVKLAEKYPGIVAIDLSAPSIEMCKKVQPKGNYIVGDFLEYEFDKKFDFIICVGVLHHFPKNRIKEGMRKIEDLLKPGGILSLGLYNTPGRARIKHISKCCKIAKWDIEEIKKYLPWFDRPRLIELMKPFDDNKIADCLLHPCESDFTVRQVIELTNLEVVKLVNMRPEKWMLEFWDKLDKIEQMEFLSYFYEYRTLLMYECRKSNI